MSTASFTSFLLPPFSVLLFHIAETKTVIAAFEKCLATADSDGLAVVRAAMEVSALLDLANKLHCRPPIPHCQRFLSPTYSSSPYLSFSHATTFSHVSVLCRTALTNWKSFSRGTKRMSELSSLRSSVSSLRSYYTNTTPLQLVVSPSHITA